MKFSTIVESMEKLKNKGLIRRHIYLDKLKGYMNKPIIKVLTGMRRVGKSSIMRMMINDLIESGINSSNILYINKESLEFDDIKDYKDLYQYTLKHFKKIDGKKYLFIDEIQEIKQWEKAVASFLADDFADIVVSGSNSKLLSSEFATLLSGRYIEIQVHPLSFKEFLMFREETLNSKPDIEKEFSNFLRYGGLPGIHRLSLTDEFVFEYLNSVLNTVLYKDIITRYEVRDIEIFDSIVKYLFDNIGNIISAKRISDYFKSQRIKVSVDTILNYIRYIESGMLIERVKRYNIKGKRHLEFNDKIFLNDIGIRNGLLGYKEKDINGILENIVYKELRTKGYKVDIGVIDGAEIDFVAQKQNDLKYIQVCYLLMDAKTVNREFGNLEKIKDNYEKIVVSMDKFFPEDRNGIKHKYILDFLLE